MNPRTVVRSCCPGAAAQMAEMCRSELEANNDAVLPVVCKDVFFQSRPEQGDKMQSGLDPLHLPVGGCDGLLYLLNTEVLHKPVHSLPQTIGN